MSCVNTKLPQTMYSWNALKGPWSESLPHKLWTTKTFNCMKLFKNYFIYISKILNLTFCYSLTYCVSNMLKLRSLKKKKRKTVSCWPLDYISSAEDTHASDHGDWSQMHESLWSLFQLDSPTRLHPTQIATLLGVAEFM